MTGGDLAVELAPEIPVFPLPGVLLLPHGRLPLNIFEARYLDMVNDALKGSRLIGMVQPTDPNMQGDKPDLYPVGCVGRITAFRETGDGRVLITLTGISRFDIAGELATDRLYRTVCADYGRFAADRAPRPDCHLDRERLGPALRAYFDANGIDADWDAFEQAPDDVLVTSLAMICPFEPSEKQALLECSDLDACADMLMSLVEMAGYARGYGAVEKH